MSPDKFFSTANYIEAALWISIGLTFAASLIRRRTAFRPRALAAVVFVVFGLSDIIETRTGAWWRPWWLLALKGGCVATLLTIAAMCWNRQRKA